MNYNRPELLDRLAAEYVVGTLTGRARRRFEFLLRTLPEARQAVTAWEDRAAKLTQGMEPEAPPSELWHAIESAIGGGTRAREPERTSTWWSNLWRPVLGFAMGAALTVGLVQWMPDRFVSLDEVAQSREMLPQSYVGLLTDANGKATVLASSTRHGKKLHIKMLQAVEAPTGQVLVLWALPTEGAPFAVGTLPAAPKPNSKGEIVLTDTAEKLFAKVPRLAASFEPAQPAANAQPSTPFVLSGHCAKLW
jgi:anti-sigma-K factor RskA